MVVVASHGFSFGLSIDRARRRAAALAQAMRLSIPIAVTALGPDGRPRVVLHYR